MMMLWLRNVIAYAVCAVASVAATRWIGSTVVVDLLAPNLTAIVVALLAINVQTTAVIAVKLRELSDKHGYRFKATIAQFRLAIVEQTVLVLASLALSAMIKSDVASNGSLAIDIAVFFVIYGALHIFADTSLGLFVALFPEEEKEKQT